MQWWRPHASIVCLRASLKGWRDERQTQLHSGKSTRTQEVGHRGGEMASLLRDCLHLSLQHRMSGSSQQFSTGQRAPSCLHKHSPREDTQVWLVFLNGQSSKCVWWEEATVQRQTPKTSRVPTCPLRCPNTALRSHCPDTQLGSRQPPKPRVSGSPQLLFLLPLLVISAEAGVHCTLSLGWSRECPSREEKASCHLPPQQSGTTSGY